MPKKINIGDFVWVYGDYEELYEVKGYFEELANEDCNSEYELCLIVENRKSLHIIEVNLKDILLIQENPKFTNDLLDKYNDYLLLEQIFNDGEYRLKARQLLISMDL